MTPRRSSRARTSQPSPAVFQHTNSSSSSNSLTRERSTRSNHKIPSPNRSQSIDDADEGSKNDFPQTRQRQRTRGEEDNVINGDGEEEEPEEDDEEEVTRCLCGQQEYPGLPPSRREALGRNGVHGKLKEESALNLPADSSDLMSDEIGSMFIQCDSCKVWQHGGCVGIMDEAMSPDEYFCEECRKDLHRIKNESNGQHSSTYLPVAPPSTAASSRESSRDNSKRSKDPKSRGGDSAANPKRRSTMNSRDAAYDEEELIRRAIEESKEDTSSPAAEDATVRRPKRSRSDSEAQKQAPKRQRTSSPSPGAASKQSVPPSQPASDDEKTKAATNGIRRQRAVSRSQRDKETKEVEEPEAESSEATTRRKGKTDKRKSDGTDSDHETGSPAKPVANDPVPPQPSPDPPAPVQEPAPPRPSTRKSGRPPARRTRVGRNQYTRDRDAFTSGADSSIMTNSPRRGQSHDTGGDSPRVGGANGAHINGGETGKPSRPRYVNQRTTLNEMKRRVAAILEFISRMQVEMAVAGESFTTPPGNGDRPNGIILKAVGDQLENVLLSTASEGESATGTADSDVGTGHSLEKDFKELTSVEMMDVLTRHLLKWQQEYGKFGER
ncbi:putative transcriptional regulator (Cti6) [Aspergillus affinis]|uniref:putative transcriptional regulator (Cti6) n=1 Tax=Aspergillus affinis TaxID=1070780 RepID=UPI0022FE7837|nr:uncharacterized protein KD926_008753 [Aspergillus affinis]KAI9045327.1 hypothetical protein KD926_008753 [Aspergillus affinis]